jgi:hypothetical protein
MEETFTEAEHFRSHGDFEKELHEKGCEFGRNTHTELKNYMQRYDSKVENIETVHRIFFDDMFPRITLKVDEAIKMSKDAVFATSEARKAAVSVQESYEKYKTSADADVKKIVDSFNALPWKLLAVNGGAIVLLVVLEFVTKHFLK